MKQYPSFAEEDRSLLKKHLTEKCFELLKDRRTSLGFGLEEVIRSGLANPDGSIGIYGPDAESYETFAELFDPIIEEYHRVRLGETQTRDLNPDLDLEPWVDPTGLVRSVRIRAGRNLRGFALGAGIGSEERGELEQRAVEALAELEGELRGAYHPLAGLSGEEQESLRKAHLLFHQGDRFLEAAGLNRDWPQGRGIFLNEGKDFIVWVNEEDHLRIISLKPGADLLACWKLFGGALKKLEELLGFWWNPRLGHIASCPTNLGTSLRASVHIHLPHLGRDEKGLRELAEGLQLQVRGTSGEHTESVGMIFDISNRQRLGVTEAECVATLHRGIARLLRMERERQGSL